jgi:hypothetical protein
MTRAAVVVTAQTAKFASRQVARAYRATEDRLGLPMTVTLAFLLALGVVILLSDGNCARAVLQSPITRGVGTTAKVAVSTMVDMQVRYQAAPDFLRNHEREEPQPPSGEMRVARVLAASREPLLEDEIARRSSIHPVAVILRNHRAFAAWPDRRWQFGTRAGLPASRVL